MVNSSLRSAPVTNKNGFLQSLILSENSIAEAPVLSHNRGLNALCLAGNDLETPPDLRGDFFLIDLDLSRNRLTQPPNLSQNPRLEKVYLQGNRLEVAPDFSQNRELAIINLQNNLLRSLPESIFTLPSSCEIRAENNPFTAEYVASFQARLVEQRVRDPKTGPIVHLNIYRAEAWTVTADVLKDELLIWSQRLSPLPDFTPLTSLDEQQRSQLLTYLTKLRGTADYIPRS